MSNETDQQQQQQSTAEFITAFVEDDTEESQIFEDSVNELNNADMILEAIKDVHINKCSLRSAASAYTIPLSSLSRYMKKINDAIGDISAATDEELLATISNVTKHHNPLLVSNIIKCWIAHHLGDSVIKFLIVLW